MLTFARIAAFVRLKPYYTLLLTLVAALSLLYCGSRYEHWRWNKREEAYLRTQQTLKTQIAELERQSASALGAAETYEQEAKKYEADIAALRQAIATAQERLRQSAASAPLRRATLLDTHPAGTSVDPAAMRRELDRLCAIYQRLSGGEPCAARRE